jgi:hypothetical protein
MRDGRLGLAKEEDADENKEMPEQNAREWREEGPAYVGDD